MLLPPPFVAPEPRRFPHRLTIALAGLLTIAWPLAAASGKREVFQTPGNGENFGIWRLTHDPTARHWANYHNTRCWSPDGRYVCYTRYGQAKTDHEVFVYDAQSDTTRRVGPGQHPRWANGHNWLIYLRLTHDDTSRQLFSEVIWADLDSGETRTLAREPGEMDRFGEIDARDEWLYAGRLLRHKQRVDGKVVGETERSALRIRIGTPGEVQDLPGVLGYQFMANPSHPLFFTRWRKGPGGDFGPSRLWYDLDGKNERIGIPLLQNAHTSWLGNGEFHLLGNGLVRGRRWDEPFPSNVHILAGVSVGDISPCGASGRYVTGDHMIADLRSGDGWLYLHPLSVICFPADVGDASDTYDADPKGSPDGTKVTFVTNYDLKEGPLTFLTSDRTADDASLQVVSTQGFPERGFVVIRNEVIGYERTTPTRFEGITRERFKTERAPGRPGQAVTSFEARLLTDAQWRQVGRAMPEMYSLIREPDSPLLRQRQTDVHVAIVRRPDRPFLRVASQGAELIPGEEHRETRGYHLLHNGRRVTRDLLVPGARFDLAPDGQYQAIAVERSGLESEPGLPLRVAGAVSLRILDTTPADFSWTMPRWIVADNTVAEEAAQKAPAAVREIVHRHDGVIAREWYSKGVLTLRHDLDRAGRPARQLAYRDGKLATRDYVDRTGHRVSREIFASGGQILETIVYEAATGEERDHWWFENGLPVRQIKGGREFGRDGDKWKAKASDAEASQSRKDRASKRAQK